MLEQGEIFSPVVLTDYQKQELSNEYGWRFIDDDFLAPKISGLAQKVIEVIMDSISQIDYISTQESTIPYKMDYNVIFKMLEIHKLKPTKDIIKLIKVAENTIILQQRG